MGASFWVRRFALVFVAALVIIAGAQLSKGNSVDYSLTQGWIWGAISASVFTTTRMYQSRRGQHCAICRDAPEMAKTSANFQSEEKQ